MFNISKEIFSHIKKERNINKYINVMLFDTETTGINKPEITQFGYIILKVEENEEKELIFTKIEENEKNYYPSKPIEVEACRITHIIREEDLNNKKYIKDIIKSFADNKKKITEAQIKKTFLILTQDLPKYDKSEFIKIKEKYNIKLYAGHNLYQYDYKEVLQDVYQINIEEIEIFDTMLTDIHNKTVKTNQGRKLSNEVKKIMKKLPSEIQEELNKLINIRDDEAHSALIDIQVNDYLFRHQLTKMKNDIENNIENDKEETFENNNDRAYKKNDILYIRTHMSEDNIITEDKILEFCKEKEIKKVIIVDEQWTKYISLIKTFNENDIDLIIGFKAFNIDTNEYTDIIIKDTLNYRLLLPLLIEGHQVTNQRLKDILKYTKNLVIPSKKMPTPKYYEEKDVINHFLANKILMNEAYTQQELEIFKKKEKINESLETGIFTSDIKQKWFKEKTKDFETMDFTFYAKLNLSAFPPLNILHPAIKKEPDNIDEAIKMLDDFYEEQWELRKIDEIIKKSGLPKEKYIERKEKEFAILKKIGKIDFIKYFFLVYKIGNIMEGNLSNDLLDKDNPNFKIIREAFGYGRGSAPGSLVAFVTGTTGLDPLKYELLFERFIDPSRPDYPDIDLDIVDKEFAFNILKQYFDVETKKTLDYTKKPYDIYDEYIIENYIKTENDFLGKIKTVAYTTPKVILGSLLRLNQQPFFIQSVVSKEFDAVVKANGGKDKDIKLEDIIEQSEMKNDILKKMPLDLFSEANKLRNIYKSSGIHAGGVLFFPHHPNIILPMKHNVVEFDMRELESLLQIKMDLLGLNTRMAIDEIKLLLKKVGKEDIIYKHNFDDMDKPEVFLGFFNKFTSQTFQMGSAGMDKLLVSLSPLKFEDIIAITALFRPGPLGSGAVDSYVSSAIKAKREKYDIDYIPAKEFEKIPDVDKKAIIEMHKRKVSQDFNIKMLKDDMIINLITSEDYFESQKFETMIEAKFNSVDSELIQEIKAKRNVTSVEEFKEVILEMENKIKSDKNFRGITKDTYHTMVYQEQIMHISVQMANYTVLGSNKLRKAIAKQKKDLMDIEKTKFINGLIEDKIINVEYQNELNNFEVRKSLINELLIINKETNEEINVSGFLNLDGTIEINEYTNEDYINLINNFNKQIKNNIAKINIKKSDFNELEAKFFWDKIESFGAYAFNKSHAASYSVITYETQYYKEFTSTIAYGVFLKHVPEKAKMQLIKEIKIRDIGLELQILDENLDTNFTIDTERDVIALPLTYIKGIGDKEILPFIELFKEYKIDTLEEMLLLAGAKARKKITDRLGQLGVFEKSNISNENPFSWISAKEWYYLAGENENPDEKGLLNSIIEKAIKNIKIQKEYKLILSEYRKQILEKEENTDGLLPNIWTNTPLLESLQTLKILSDNLSHSENSSNGTDEDNKKVLKYFTDVQKAQETLDKLIEKFNNTAKVLESEKEALKEAIENKEYDFYKRKTYKKGFEQYKNIIAPQIKDLSIKLREFVKENYKKAEINKKIQNILNVENYERELSKGEQSDINDRLLKEGNFDNNIDLNYEAMEDTINLKLKPDQKEINDNPYEDDIIYNQFYKNEKGQIIETNKTNVIYLTEFLPKVAKNGFETKHERYGSKTQDFFVDLYDKMPLILKNKVKLAWMSYHTMTEPQFKEKFEENYIEKEELEEYNEFRFKNILLNIADSKVENIILAAPPKSKLMDSIKKYKFKGFNPQNGDTAIVYLKNSKGEKVKKIFAFVPNMFPYKDLNPKKYEEDLNMIIKILEG